MTKIVLMTITMWMPVNGQLHEAWRIEEKVTLEHCLMMNEMFAQGGKLAASVVRCEQQESENGTVSKTD